MNKKFKDWKAYVEFKSKEFLRGNFVLVWAVQSMDAGRCVFEPLHPPIDGQAETTAFALTLVSNVMLDPEEHGELNYTCHAEFSCTSDRPRQNTSSLLIEAGACQDLACKWPRMSSK